MLGTVIVSEPDQEGFEMALLSHRGWTVCPLVAVGRVVESNWFELGVVSLPRSSDFLPEHLRIRWQSLRTLVSDDCWERFP